MHKPKGNELGKFDFSQITTIQVKNCCNSIAVGKIIVYIIRISIFANIQEIVLWNDYADK
jgi:hypothetical protein